MEPHDSHPQANATEPVPNHDLDMDPSHFAGIYEAARRAVMQQHSTLGISPQFHTFTDFVAMGSSRTSRRSSTRASGNTAPTSSTDESSHFSSSAATQYPLIRPKPAQPSDLVSVSNNIQRITCNGILILNHRAMDFDTAEGVEVLSHLAPDCSGHLDNYPGVLRLDQTLAICRSWIVTAPTAHFTILSSDALVQEQEGEAVVWVDVDVSGLEENTVRLRAFCEACWRRERDGKWLLYRFNAMRAPSAGDEMLPTEPLD